MGAECAPACRRGHRAILIPVTYLSPISSARQIALVTLGMGWQVNCSNYVGAPQGVLHDVFFEQSQMCGNYMGRREVQCDQPRRPATCRDMQRRNQGNGK